MKVDRKRLLNTITTTQPPSTLYPDYTPAPTNQHQTQTFVSTVTNPDFLGSLSPCLYETCLALSSDIDNADKQLLLDQLGPAYLRTLSTGQFQDGSWGSDERVDMPADRVISTLAALLALATHNRLEAKALGKATNYLIKGIPAVLSPSNVLKTIAMEGVILELVVRCKNQGVPIPVDDAALAYGLSRRDSTLAKKLTVLNDKPGTITSILDAMTSSPAIAWESFADFQEADGSMGIYPSSTVALLEHTPRGSSAYVQGLNYLRDAMAPNKGLPPFFPSSHFEQWWALFFLSRTQLKPVMAQSAHVTALAPIPTRGLPVAPSFSLPDVDTTAMKAATLLSLGIDVDLTSLAPFFRDGAFQCYEAENRVSPSANVHALMAIAAQASAPAHHGMIPQKLLPMFCGALEYLLSSLGDNGSYSDKWHLSPIYTTAHAAELFAQLLQLRGLPISYRTIVQAKLGEMTAYLLDQHKPDGGWGSSTTSSVEETAYMMHALASLARYRYRSVDAQLFNQAKYFLISHRPAQDPPLWIGKTLYRSAVITQALQLSAISLIAEFAQEPGVTRRMAYTH